MAAALLQKNLAAANIGARVRSAGTHGGVLTTDPEAVAAMSRHGLDIRTHRPRLLTHAILTNEGADLVITMTREQLRAVSVMCEGVFARAFTMRELARRGLPTHQGRQLRDASVKGWLQTLSVGRNACDLVGEDPNDDVADPYGLTPAAHLATAAQIDECMAEITRALGTWSD
jgi:protein-tyrosine-phosphatase